MAYNGRLQSTIVYVVSQRTGQPLDINMQPTSATGLRQAIYIMNGWVNPDESRYQVAGTFNENGSVSGTPTFIQNITRCPIGGSNWILRNNTWDNAGSWDPSGLWNY